MMYFFNEDERKILVYVNSEEIYRIANKEQNDCYKEYIKGDVNMK